MQTKKMRWDRHLTEGELEKARIELTNLLIEIDEIKDEKKLVVADYKDRIKPKAERLQLIKMGLKSGTLEEHREVNLVPDHDSGIMYYLDPESGEALHSRRLTPTERQLTIQ